MAKTVHARTLAVQSLSYRYGKIIVPPYEVDIEFTPQEEAALESGITAEMIPDAASASNQLADKQYVDTSVSTSSATFLGTSAPGLTEQQFLTWADSLERDNNDYCYWLTTDSSGRTVYKRYKYNGTQWLYEYDVADPSSIPTALADLTDDSTHRLVTDDDKTNWNGKANASEMSVVQGTGADEGKVTITLKTGTSAQVLGAECLATINGTIESNERVTSAALNDLNTRKLDASEYVPTDLSDYYTKEEVEGLLEEMEGDIEDTELVVSSALNDLETRKLDASEYVPVDLSNYYTKSEVNNLVTSGSSVVALTADVTSSCSITGVANSGKQETIVYTNSSGSDKTVTIPTTYSTPNGQAIVLTCPTGCYCEVSYLNIGGTVFARGI